MSATLLQTLARYNSWAHRRLFAHIEANLPASSLTKETGLFARSIHGTLNHIAVADLLWLSRLTGQNYDGALISVASGIPNLPSTLAPLWSDDSDPSRWERAIDPSCGRDLLTYTSSQLTTVVSSISDQDAMARISYLDTAGSERSQVRGLALLHVFNHATHHRGQITTVITQMGALAPELDLTAFLAEESSGK